MKRLVLILFFLSIGFCAYAEDNVVEKELTAKSGAKINFKFTLQPSWKISADTEDKKDDKMTLAFTCIKKDQEISKGASISVAFDKADKEDTEAPQKYADSAKAIYSNLMNKKDNKYKIEQEEVAISNIKSIKLSYYLSLGNATTHFWQYLIRVNDDIIILTCASQKGSFQIFESDFKNIAETVEIKPTK